MEIIWQWRKQKKRGMVEICAYLIILTFIIIYRNKIKINIFGIFFSHKVKTKVQKGNGFWTFINVHF